MALINFTDADLTILQEVVRDYKTRRQNQPSRSHPDQPHQAPEVYVAKPQSAGGIPALSGDVPGEGVCDIYQIILDGSGDPTLEEVVNFDKTVYNIGGAASQIPLLIARTKYGKWVPIVSTKPCDFVRFIINSVYQDVAPYYAVVDILSRTCGCSVVEEETEAGTGTGETIIVYDMAGCNFDEPAVDLIDRVGYAKYMIDEEYELLAPDTGTGTGTAGTGDCRWEVITLCCPGVCVGTGTA